MPFLCLAASGASKAALALLMDTFCSEFQPWGIKVSLVLPGYCKTRTTCDPAFRDWQKQQLVARLPWVLLKAYSKDYMEEINCQFIQFMKVAVEDLSTVLNCITDGLLAANPAKGWTGVKKEAWRGYRNREQVEKKKLSRAIAKAMMIALGQVETGGGGMSGREYVEVQTGQDQPYWQIF
ncbi:11-beta-hydroxysteroid dehydrogenase type 2-like [Guaruba guarouba]